MDLMKISSESDEKFGVMILSYLPSAAPSLMDSQALYVGFFSMTLSAAI